MVLKSGRRSTSWAQAMLRLALPPRMLLDYDGFSHDAAFSSAIAVGLTVTCACTLPTQSRYHGQGGEKVRFVGLCSGWTLG